MIHYVSLYLYRGVNPFSCCERYSLASPCPPLRSPAAMRPFSLQPHHDQINTVLCRARLRVIMTFPFSQRFLLPGLPVLWAPQVPCPPCPHATLPGEGALPPSVWTDTCWSVLLPLGLVDTPRAPRNCLLWSPRWETESPGLFVLPAPALWSCFVG